MPTWSTLKSLLLFGNAKTAKSKLKNNEERIVDYVIGLVNREDLIAKLIQGFRQSQRLPEPAREMAFVRLYFSLEDFIARNKPATVKKNFTRESLREDVRKNFDLNSLKPGFRLIFLPNVEQKAWLFADRANLILDYVKNNLGRAYCQNMLRLMLQKNPLRLWVGESLHINPEAGKTVPAALTSDELTLAFKDFYLSLHKESLRSFGEKKTAEIFQKTLDGIKERYDFDLISAFLEILPEEIAASERLVFLSREQLEKKVVAATLEEQSKRRLAERLTAELGQAVRDLKKTKSEIEREKAKDEAVLESIGEGLFVTDERGRVTVTNHQAEIMLGRKPQDILGEPVDAFFAPLEASGKENNKEKTIPSALTSGEKTSVIYQILRKGQPGFPAHVTITPFILNQRITGRVAVFRDITREKEIDRAKSEFVSLASHQLRTPLSTISWYAEMLLSGDAGPLKPEQKEYLEEIYHGNQRMVQLVNALLNVSRIELGTFVVELESVDVAEIARSVIKELQPKIRMKLLKVSENYQQPVPAIPADSKLIRIILQNLITNAVKYTPPEGQISISISVKDASKLKPSALLIAVTDTGYGIPESQYRKIFTKLFRADNVREKETDGTGLGLYLVKSVLDASGGEIWFESQENKGSTFYVAIPLTGMKAKQGEKHLA